MTRLIQVYLDIVQAMAYAHGRGVVHRYLKPANIMLGEHGEVQVLAAGRRQGADHRGEAASDRGKK